MSETTGLPVAGYKPTQPEWAIAMVNENKALEEHVLRQLDKMKGMAAAVDQRCVALAITGIQDAFMWANRAIFQPQRVKLPGDPVE